MKALTIYQPCASLIAIGAKRYKTCSWATEYRGPITIHAGKKKPSEVLGAYEMAETIETMGTALGITNPRRYIEDEMDNLPCGAIIAVAELVGCFEMWDGRNAGFGEGIICISRTNGYWSPNWQGDSNEYIFGDWRVGRYAWELADVRMLEPVPCRGRQGLWTLSAEVEARIRAVRRGEVER